MIKIDVFSHILTPQYYEEFRTLHPGIEKDAFYISRPILCDISVRERWHRRYPDVLQCISMVNLNPEDYFDPETAARMCRLGNDEMNAFVKDYPDMFYGAVAMVPMNNIPAALEIIDEYVNRTEGMLGIQLFTMALGKPIAAQEYRPIFAKMAEIGKPIWLHPVFDATKQGNNLNFSWEYELSNAMQSLILADIFCEYPELKIIVHHAGAMVPFYMDRLKFGTPHPYAEQFRKFYVDTALYGNPKGLELACDYYGVDHVFFGTDSPLGPPPGGVVEDTILAVESMDIQEADKRKIFRDNAISLFQYSV